MSQHVVRGVAKIDGLSSSSARLALIISFLMAACFSGPVAHAQAWRSFVKKTINDAKGTISQSVAPASSSAASRAPVASGGAMPPATGHAGDAEVPTAGIQAGQSTPEDLSRYETHGPAGFTYCFTMVGKVTYLSAIFKANGQTPGTTIEQFRAAFSKRYALPFRSFVDVKYSQPINRQGSYDCRDPLSTVAEAQQDMQKYHGDAGNQVIHTTWTGSSNDALAQMSPDGRNSMFITRGIAAEYARLADDCSRNATLGQTLDCSCYAEHMHQARLSARNTMRSESSLLEPRLSQLMPVAHLEACTSEKRLEATARKQISAMSIQPDLKERLKACAPPKFAALALASPESVYQRAVLNSLFMRAATTCQ